MGLDTLAQLGEFVGGVFVIVSLVYLARQVGQNTKSLRTENYARVMDRMSTLQSRLSVDSELNRIFVIGAEDPGRLSPSERVRYSWAMYELFGAAEFMFHQSLERGLPPIVWKRWEAALAWWLSYPGMRAWWAAKPAPLAADFEAFAADLIANHRMDPERVKRWRGFVAGDGMSSSTAAA